MAIIYSYTFDADLDGWTRLGGAPINWIAGDGDPSNGCCEVPSWAGAASAYSPNVFLDGYVINANTNARFRVKTTNVAASSFRARVINSGPSHTMVSTSQIAANGWVSYDVSLAAIAAATFTQFEFDVVSNVDWYLDTWELYEPPSYDATVGGLAPTTMDVSADDYYLYVGILDGSNQPILLRLLSDLSADPDKMYEPGAGTAIGVKCGDEYESVVWIAGDFGTPLVRLSIDDGATWVTKDPGTWAGVALPFVVGPWWDDLFLVPTDGDDDMHETEDGGLNWATLNASLPIDVGGMDRLDINLDEIVIGSDAGRDIYYSPNNAAGFEDISDLGMTDVRITDVVVG